MLEMCQPYSGRYIKMKKGRESVPFFVFLALASKESAVSLIQPRRLSSLDPASEKMKS